MLPHCFICKWLMIDENRPLGFASLFMIRILKMSILTSSVMLFQNIFWSRPAQTSCVSWIMCLLIIQNDSGNRGSLRVCCSSFLAWLTSGKIFTSMLAHCTYSRQPRFQLCLPAETTVLMFGRLEQIPSCIYLEVMLLEVEVESGIFAANCFKSLVLPLSKTFSNRRLMEKHVHVVYCFCLEEH